MVNKLWKLQGIILKGPRKQMECSFYFSGNVYGIWATYTVTPLPQPLTLY